MKNSNQLITQTHQTIATWQEQSQKDMLVPTLLKDGKAEVSIFDGKPAEIPQIAACVKKLSTVFPQMPAAFFNILTERIVKRGLSASRLEYAVEQVIDNYTYQRMTIADIMSIDKRFQILSFSEMINEARKNGRTTDDYAPIRIGNEEKPFWVHKADKVKYNIPDRL